jgi:hypothetical protein
MVEESFLKLLCCVGRKVVDNHRLTDINIFGNVVCHISILGLAPHQFNWIEVRKIGW